MPGTPELFVIFILVLLLFGPDKLPDLARQVGRGIREIRKITDDFKRQINLDDK
ncbi:MAG: twin-arginine translocase TatA/TatE family subunit [Abditibacteriaceae bacterium]